MAGKLLEGVPDVLKKKFEVKTQYKQSRRITFVCEEGGECCWELREKMMGYIEAKKIKQNGKKSIAESGQGVEEGTCHRVALI